MKGLSRYFVPGWMTLQQTWGISRTTGVARNMKAVPHYLESRDILSTEIDLTPFVIQPNQMCSYTIFNASIYIHKCVMLMKSHRLGNVYEVIWHSFLSTIAAQWQDHKCRSISAEKTRFGRQISDTVLFVPQLFTNIHLFSRKKVFRQIPLESLLHLVA